MSQIETSQGAGGLRVSTLRNNLRIERGPWDKRNPGEFISYHGSKVAG